MPDYTLPRRSLLAATLGLLVMPPLRAQTPGPLTEAILRQRVRDRFGAVAERLSELAAKDEMSGVVAVALGDETLFEQAWGFADRAARRPNRLDTRFDLASMSKLFTAVAVARLAEQGKLRWQDKVADIVPGLPETFAPVTIADLLTHRSGLGSYFASPLFAERVAHEGRSVSDYLEIVRQDRPSPTPYQYSNNGFVLLGVVIERLTGQDYFEAVRRLVYAPAGMRTTGHPLRTALGPNDARGYTAGCFMRPPSVCTPQPLTEVPMVALRGTPAGGGYANAPDLLRFASALRGGRLVRRDTLALMTRRHVDGMPPGGPIDGYGYGMGLLRIRDHESFGHNGGTPGASAQLDLLTEVPLTILVLTNLDGAQRAASSLLRRALLAEADG